MAAKTDGSVAILKLDRSYGPTSIACVHDATFPIVNVGMVTSIAASPTGEWWFFGVNKSLSATAQNGGEVYLCHLPTTFTSTALKTPIMHEQALV